MTRDELYMKKALELAEMPQSRGKYLVGAIVVKRSSGEIIGRGFNRREYGHSPLTHAELVAIEEASRNLGVGGLWVVSFLLLSNLVLCVRVR